MPGKSAEYRVTRHFSFFVSGRNITEAIEDTDRKPRESEASTLVSTIAYWNVGVKGARSKSVFALSACSHITMSFTRRSFLSSALGLGLAASTLPNLPIAQLKRLTRPPRILLRGSWQSVNIGDIGHTPGALNLIERHLPEADLTLWPTELGHGAQEFLQKAFPRLKIARGTVEAGKPSTPELAQAWEENDFMLHGSSAGFGARAHLAAWHRATGKPYGAFGITFDPINNSGRNTEGSTLDGRRAQIQALPPTHLDAETRWIIDHAAFVFARETTTRDYFRRSEERRVGKECRSRWSPYH